MPRLDHSGMRILCLAQGSMLLVHIPASVLHAVFVLTLAACNTVQSFVVVEDLIVIVFYVSMHGQVHL